MMASQAPAYRLSPTQFATESAFAEHLLELRSLTRDRFANLVLLSSELTEHDYLERKSHMRTIDSTASRVWFSPTHSAGVGPGGFAVRLPEALANSVRRLRRAGLVHADLAYDIRRPMSFLIAAVARIMRKPVVFVVDTDFRLHAKRYRQLGDWGGARYLVNTLAYIPLRAAQVRFAVKFFQLVMLKSPAMVRDFGREQAHVRAFYDTVHGSSDIASSEEVAERVARMEDRAHGLRLVYFGRLVSYKGVDRMVSSLAHLRDRGRDLTLQVVGDGPELDTLRRQVHLLSLDEVVTFTPQVPYGQQLFAVLSNMDVTLAAPLVEDTPRAAFDAFARGLPIVAFDISYFKDLAQTSGAVGLAEWPSAESLADTIAELDSDRELLVSMTSASVDHARENTQDMWLRRRLEWTLAILR